MSLVSSKDIVDIKDTFKDVSVVLKFQLMCNKTSQTFCRRFSV